MRRKEKKGKDDVEQSILLEKLKRGKFEFSETRRFQSKIIVMNFFFLLFSLHS